MAEYCVNKTEKIIGIDNITEYVEPFCGGCNVIDKIECDKKYASDINKYLIELFKHIQKGLPLPDEVPRELYSDVRSNVNNTKYEDWYIGAIGFLASYNGRFFDGGYAQAGYEKTKTGQRYRDYYQESKRNILEQVPNIKDIEFTYKSYNELKPFDAVIYCDPPYQGVKQYANSLKFDYDEFWNTMRNWSKDNIVLISEQNAPDDFKCIWQQEVSRSIKATDKSKSVEKLFTYSYTK